MKAGIKIIVVVLMALAVRMSAQSAETKKVDEFEDFGCESLKARTEELYRELIKDEGSRGYIIVYEGQYHPSLTSDRYVLPRVGEANSRILAIRTHMKFLKIDRAPIKITFGGYREHLEVEYFLIPAGGANPKTSPTLKRIKHRKGRAVFFVNPAEC